MLTASDATHMSGLLLGFMQLTVDVNAPIVSVISIKTRDLSNHKQKIESTS